MEVRDRTPFIVGDFVISRSTIHEVAERLKECGAVKVYALETQGVFALTSTVQIEQSHIEKHCLRGRRLLFSSSLAIRCQRGSMTSLPGSFSGQGGGAGLAIALRIVPRM